MMRLIDATELMEHVYRDKLDSRELIVQLIENMPTIKSMDNDYSNILTALKKQIPQKVTKSSYFYGYIYGCPCCDNYVSKERNSTIQYCSHCGQALDWGKNE